MLFEFPTFKHVNWLLDLKKPKYDLGSSNIAPEWTGYAKGRGGDCSDADVQVQVLEDYSIIGTAQVFDFNMIIKLKGQRSGDGKLRASGFGAGGVSVSYKGNFNVSTASGTWIANRPGCEGTWELAKK